MSNYGVLTRLDTYNEDDEHDSGYDDCNKCRLYFCYCFLCSACIMLIEALIFLGYVLYKNNCDLSR